MDSVKHLSKSDKDSTRVSYSVNKANDLLIYKNFEDCLILCQEELGKLRQHPDEKSFDDIRNALCVDAIQAFAELNRWQEVLPFVTQLYGNIKEVPANITQLCILLHAEVQDYPTCAALGNLWLKNPSNASPDKEQGYLETVDVYVGHVLIPANRWNDIEPFLDSCPGLNAERKSRFLKVTRTLRHQLEQVAAEEIEELSESEEVVNQKAGTTRLSGAEDKHDVIPSSRFTMFVKKFTSWASSSVPIVTMHMIRHLAIIGLILFILITRADVDLLSWETLYKLWNLITATWKRMFAPFHMVKR